MLYSTRQSSMRAGGTNGFPFQGHIARYYLGTMFVMNKISQACYLLPHHHPFPIALFLADMATTPKDLTSRGAHPLLYASLMPIKPLTKVSRIDLHKPKALYNVGRNPQSDIVLTSQHIGMSIDKREIGKLINARLGALHSTMGWAR